MRIDVALHRLCLTRSRSEAKDACEAGAIELDGSRAKPSQEVREGSSVTLRFSNRLLEIRVLSLPPKSTSKKAAREMYEVVRDERLSEL